MNNPSVFIGYFPKRPYRRGGLSLEGASTPFPVAEAEEICSVSGCIARSPERWTEDLIPNEFWGFESPDSAWAAVFGEDRPEFELFAYKLFPVRFMDGQEVPLELPQVSVDALPNYYVRLGFDAVELLGEEFPFHFGCSPLTCNSPTRAGNATTLVRARRR